MNRPILDRITKGQLLFVTGVIYLALFVGLDFLRFAPRKDELHFWPTALSFSTAWVPSLDQLRGYSELNTPLPFLLFGDIEHLFHGGIAVGRFLNFAISFGVIALIVGSSASARSGALAATGLMFFPYYLGLSVHLYTDMIAAAFVLLGLVFHLRQKAMVSMLCFALAIASRQFMVAFPLALVAYELRRPGGFQFRELPRWISPALGAATLGGWIWLFGGPAPSGALALRGLDANRLQLLDPARITHLLACVGVFYVIPELLLFRENRRRHKSVWLAIGIALATIAFCVAFPPLANPRGVPTLGIFDRLLVMAMGPPSRTLLYAVLAALSIVRFSELSLAGFLVASNAAILVLSDQMWEKYALALLVCLWFLRGQATAHTVKSLTDEFAQMTSLSSGIPRILAQVLGSTIALVPFGMNLKTEDGRIRSDPCA